MAALVILVGAFAAWRRPVATGWLLVAVGLAVTPLSVWLIDFARGLEDNPGPWGFREALVFVVTGGVPLLAGILFLLSAPPRGPGPIARNDTLDARLNRWP